MKTTLGLGLLMTVTALTPGCARAVDPGAAGAGPKPAQAAAEDTTEPKNLPAIAASMPELVRRDGVVALPLTTTGALAWRGIRGGITITEAACKSQPREAGPGPVEDQPPAKPAGSGEGKNPAPKAAADPPKTTGVTVAYKRTRNLPAGAAMVVRPGSLSGLKEVRVRLTSERTQRLLVCFKDGEGVVWTLPSVLLSDEGVTERTLSIDDIAPDAYQNSGAVTAKFDAGKVVMITLLDIGGYMSLGEPSCRWTIERVEGVCK